MSDAPTKTGTLKRGLKVGDQVHKEFELREGTAGDYFAAESSGVASEKSISFQAALVAQQLVRIGSYEGPFTLAMLGKLHPNDLNRLIRVRQELETAGEGEQPG